MKISSIALGGLTIYGLLLLILFILACGPRSYGETVPSPILITHDR